MKIPYRFSLFLACAGAPTMAGVVWQSPAYAQQAPPDDAIKEVARQRYEDGVKAFDAKRYEDARLAFLQAYNLTKVSAVLYNLALSELRANRPVDAGNHLLQFLRETPGVAPDKKAAATAALDECRQKAAQLTITVDASGADVSVDGTLVGKSPLTDPVFVEPGARTIVATVHGKSGMARVDAKRGQTVATSVATGSSAPPGPSPEPGPTTSPPGPGPAIGPTTGPGTPPDTGPTLNPYGSQPETPDRGRQGFFDWYASRPLAWVGTGLFAVGLGVGIGFSAASATSASDTESIAAQIRNRADADGVSGAPCGPEDSDGSADAYPGACQQLRDALGIHSANTAVAIVGWVTAGVAAGGTVTYIMVDWYANDGGGEDSAPPPAVSLTPVVGPAYIGVSGRF